MEIYGQGLGEIHVGRTRGHGPAVGFWTQLNSLIIIRACRSKVTESKDSFALHIL